MSKASDFIKIVEEKENDDVYCITTTGHDTLCGKKAQKRIHIHYASWPKPPELVPSGKWCPDCQNKLKDYSSEEEEE